MSRVKRKSGPGIIPRGLRAGGGCLLVNSLEQGLEVFHRSSLGGWAISDESFLGIRRRIAIGDPICSPHAIESLARELKDSYTRVVFLQVGELAAQVLVRLGCDVMPLGYETEIALPDFHLSGRKRSGVRRLYNKAKREGVRVAECRRPELRESDLNELDERWLETKGRRELRLLTRPLPSFEEGDVRWFSATSRGRLLGLATFDPVYRDGRVAGYYQNHLRYLPDTPHGTTDALIVSAIEKFQSEGRSFLSLGMSPLGDAPASPNICGWKSLMLWKALRSARRYAEPAYPFRGNEFFKRRYAGKKKPVFAASSGGRLLADLAVVVRALNLLPSLRLPGCCRVRGMVASPT